MSSFGTMQSFVNQHPDVHMYIAIDVSGSMAGRKIYEVCQRLYNLLSNCPPDTIFSIVLFNSRAWSVVKSKRARNIDIAGLLSHIEGRCSGRTALYDTWGDLVSSIPIPGLYLKLGYYCLYYY